MEVVGQTQNTAVNFFKNRASSKPVIAIYTAVPSDAEFILDVFGPNFTEKRFFQISGQLTKLGNDMRVSGAIDDYDYEAAAKLTEINTQQLAEQISEHFKGSEYFTCLNLTMHSWVPSIAISRKDAALLTESDHGSIQRILEHNGIVPYKK